MAFKYAYFCKHKVQWKLYVLNIDGLKSFKPFNGCSFSPVLFFIQLSELFLNHFSRLSRRPTCLEYFLPSIHLIQIKNIIYNLVIKTVRDTLLELIYWKRGNLESMTVGSRSSRLYWQYNISYCAGIFIFKWQYVLY